MLTHGQPKLIRDDIDDQQVQLYLRSVREGSGNISARVVMGGAQDNLEYYGKDFAKLLIDTWAYSLLKRMNFVRRKVTTSKSKYALADFAEIKFFAVSSRNSHNGRNFTTKLVLN